MRLSKICTVCLWLIISACDTVDPPTPLTPDAEVEIELDTTAPQWPEGASLSAERIAPAQLDLVWRPATDDRFVAGYRLFEGTRELGEVPSQETSFTVTDLVEATEYTFAVVAEDAAGNEVWTLAHL